MTGQTTRLPSPADSPAVERVPRASWIALLVAVALVVGCRIAGDLLTAAGVDLHLGEGWPLHARWRPDLTGAGVLLPIVLAGLAVWHAQRLAATLRWGGLLVTAYLGAVAWAVTLALSEGVTGLTRPLSFRMEYPHDVDRVTDLATFLPTFADHIVDQPRWATHVGGHPPGAFGTFVLLDRIGLGGPLSVALICVAVGAAAVPAVLATVRVLGEEDLARRAAPFLVFAPAALWLAVSADALFTGVSATGICALAYAARRRDWRGDGLAALGGLALGVTLFLSYGLALLGPLAIAVVAARLRIRPLVIGGVAVLAVVAAFAAGGFLWWEGLALTVERVHLGAAWRDRPQPYFWFANLAALAIAVGPATVAALPLIRRRPTAFWVLPAGALLAVGVAGVSGLTTGEVERIYLPFAVWLIPAAGLLPARSARGWLAAQAALALILEALLRTLW